MSRYEAAFKKMARAAGSNDAEVVITKFVSRNETRAGLLDERAQMTRRKAELDADQKALGARLSEMQYSMVHPAMTENALRQLDPKLTKAAGRLELLTVGNARLRDLELAAAAGCAALLTRVAAAVPSLGAAPDEDFRVEEGKQQDRSKAPRAARSSSDLDGADGSPSESDAKRAVPAPAPGPAAPGVDEAATVGLDERVLSIFRACEGRLERLVSLLDTGRMLAEGESTAPPTPSMRERRGSLTGASEHSSTAPSPALNRRNSGTFQAGLGAKPPRATAGGVGSGGDIKPNDPLLHPPPPVPGAPVDMATALNIRIQPANVEPPRVLNPSDGATPQTDRVDTGLRERGRLQRAGSARANRDAGPSRGAAAGAGLGGASFFMTQTFGEDDDEDSERLGFFGEERRRVKSGEGGARPSSARSAKPAGDMQPHPPSSQSARGDGATQRGRRLQSADTRRGSSVGKSAGRPQSSR